MTKPRFEIFNQPIEEDPDLRPGAVEARGPDGELLGYARCSRCSPAQILLDAMYDVRSRGFTGSFHYHVAGDVFERAKNLLVTV